MSRLSTKIIYLIISLVVGTPAWIWLFIHDWKIALVLFLIMFANNLNQKYQ